MIIKRISNGFLPAFLLSTLVPSALAVDNNLQSKAEALLKKMNPSLVNITIIKPFAYRTGDKMNLKNIIINGSIVDNYRPQIQEVYPTVGIVFDKRGHIIVCLGDRWLDLKNQANKLEVMNPSDQRKFEGKVIGVDQRTGSAVIYSEAKFTPASIKVSAHLKPGQDIASVDLQESSPSVRIGTIESMIVDSQPDGRFLVTFNDKARRTSYCGRPILDLQGNVIGFSTGRFGFNAMKVRKPTQEVVLPMANIVPIAQKIIATGEDIPSGWLGLLLDDITPSWKRKYHLNADTGVFVRHVVPGSPAERAGLMKGDIIVAFEGTKITTMNQLVDLVKSAPIGKKVSIEVARGQKQQTVQAVVEKRKEIPQVYVDLPESLEIQIPPIRIPKIETPAVEIQPKDIKVQIPRFGIISRGSFLRFLGMSTDNLTPQLGDFFGVKDGKGVLVTSITKEGAADKAGIRAGDVIVKIDDASISNWVQLYREVQKKNPGDKLKMSVVREKKNMEVNLVLDEKSRPLRGKLRAE